MTIPWKNNTYRQKENQVTTERAQTVACKCVEGLPRCPSGEECLPTQEAQEMQVQSLGGKDPLEKEMATHPSNLAWRIPQTKEPGGLPSIGSLSRTPGTHARMRKHAKNLQPPFCYQWNKTQIAFVTVLLLLCERQAASVVSHSLQLYGR